jgi:hypothetical protein
LSALAKVATEKETQLQSLTSAATALLPKAQAFAITDDVTKAKAIEIVKVIKGRVKLINALKTEVVTEQKAALDLLTKKFTSPVKLYGSAESALKDKIIAYDQEVERGRARAALAAASEAKAGNAEAAHAALVHAASSPERTQGVSEVKRWTVKIVDASKIPYQYMTPNESALLEVARAHNGNMAVPGVVFEQITSLSIRI